MCIALRGLSLTQFVSRCRLYHSGCFLPNATTSTFLEQKVWNMSSSSSSAHSNRGDARVGGGIKSNTDHSRGRGAVDGRPGKDKIDALGRLLTRILRHMASELNLEMRNDGYVKVTDLLHLNIKSFANIPLKAHSTDDIMEAVRKDNKHRFSLLEENGELLIRANQGHTIKTIESESLLKPMVSAEEITVCVHGTYRRNLDSILKNGLKRMQRLHVHFSCGLPTDGEVISDGLKFYISDNRVILTEGFDGVVPIKYFEKIESWPDRKLIPFDK